MRLGTSVSRFLFHRITNTHSSKALALLQDVLCEYFELSSLKLRVQAVTVQLSRENRLAEQALCEGSRSPAPQQRATHSEPLITATVAV